MATLAGSLKVLRDEVNAAYPGRSKLSDGWIGDAAHAARKSDHNPDSKGIVRAIDVTEWDPNTPDVDLDDVAEALAEYLRKSQDGRVKYVIWRGRMFSSYSTSTRRAWEWGPYSGPNGHFKHVHVSVVQDPAGSSTRRWGFKKPTPVKFGFRPGDAGKGVEFLEHMLNILYKQRINSKGRIGGAQIKTDGWYEAQTTEAVREFQRFINRFSEYLGKLPPLEVDGIAGPLTLEFISEWVPVALKGK